ncbi:MAG: glycoside hydrolase family 13 [Ferruginibacter sp.]
MTKKVLFSLPSELVANASDGILLGEFNNWNIEEGIHLHKQEDGSMRAELILTAGKTYEYRYLLNDGRWVNDNNEKKFPDVFGNTVENCVLTVPAPVKKTATAKPKAVVKKEKPIVQADDLTKIEGIGKKVAALLNKENIITYKDLAKCSIKKLQLILDTAGSKFILHDPGTWPRQAKLAVSGDWETLNKLQEELKGGK